MSGADDGIAMFIAISLQFSSVRFARSVYVYCSSDRKVTSIDSSPVFCVQVVLTCDWLTFIKNA